MRIISEMLYDQTSPHLIPTVSSHDAVHQDQGSPSRSPMPP